MQAQLQADAIHARLGLILSQADECLAHLKERERLARRVRASRTRRARASAA